MAQGKAGEAKEVQCQVLSSEKLKASGGLLPMWHWPERNPNSVDFPALIMEAAK